MSPDFNPLTSELPREFTPERLPIVYALAQIRFPPIKSIARDGYIASFQENVRGQYPEYEKKGAIRVTVAPNGPVAEEVFSGHRFADARSQNFVSLAEDFVAVVAPAYGKDAFLGRLGHIVAATAECLKPAYVAQCGVRFICRLTGDDVDNIKSQVSPGFLPPALAHIQKNEPGTQSRAVYETGEKFLLIAQWGFVPPGGEIPELQKFNGASIISLGFFGL